MEQRRHGQPTAQVVSVKQKANWHHLIVAIV